MRLAEFAGPGAVFAFVAGVAAASAPSLAQARDDSPAAGFSWEAEVGAVSDYRFRGVSVSDGPAVQGGVTAYAPGGFYAGVWSSSIEAYGVGPDGDGARAEVDFSFGRSVEAAGYTFDVSAAVYTYPDGDDVNYVEFPVSVSRVVGAWTWTAGGAWAPAQTGTGDRSNSYVYGGVDWAWPHRPLTLGATLGREDGAFADNKLDWSAGARYDLGRATLSLTYVDTDDASAKAALVAGISFKFGG